MAKIDLSTVYKVTAKGKTYLYAWRGKGAPRLVSKPGTPEFVQELATALATRKSGDKTKLSGLIARYKASDDWSRISEKQRKGWAPWLDKIQVEFGDTSLMAFDRPGMTPVIRGWRDKYRATPRAADVALEAFSRLMSFARAEGKLTLNVVTPIPRLYKANRAEIIWTDEDIDRLRQTAPEAIMWAVEMAMLTGLRQGDLLRLSWSHVGKHAIEIQTSKSGKTLTALVPMHAALRAALAKIPKRATTVLTGSEGRPWKTGFGSSWQKAVQKAGIDKHFHDLRGTAATKLFKAGFKVREIAAVMAWSEDQVDAIIKRYVNRDEVLKDMIRRMDDFSSGKASSGDDR